jgi:UDP-N-acetylglucosamine 2-epimerase (non-hydrolysing)
VKIKKILIVIGTRPNFIKVTRFKEVVKMYPEFDVKIVHTGQHYDDKMADVFFNQFNLFPDYYLNISPASPNRQIAEILEKLEDLTNEIGKPDLLMVPGDVNSTLAGAIFANKAGIKLGHIEAGLRSFDRSMPEEFNRLLADELSDLYFVTEPSGEMNLLNEGVSKEKIHFVGNTMIDTMVCFQKQINQSDVLQHFNVDSGEFVLMTMHRPATVDNREELKKLLELIQYVTASYKVVFPIHPRTIKNAKEFGLYAEIENNLRLICTEPLDYFSFQKLIQQCAFILTDSGGIQEESTFVGKPCLTLRPNTERPITVDVGSNTLVPFDLEIIKGYIRQIIEGKYKKGNTPELWDGYATERIMQILKNSI